jgi:Fe2+ transport system protein FeoA
VKQTKDKAFMNGHDDTLATMQRGQKAVISAVNATDPLVQRLMTLGLVEGAEIERASSAIGGDPLEFRLFGTGISLRQEQARQFAVADLSPAR